MSRGRSTSPRRLDRTHDSSDAEMRSASPSPHDGKGGTNLKVIVITNLSRNVVEPHLRTIFSFYGEIKKIDLPLYGKSGQNRGKAALEYFEPAAAVKAMSHMNKGQLDGATLSVELSDAVLRDRSRSRSPRPPPPLPQRARNDRGYRRSLSRSLSPFPRRRGPPPPPPRDRDRDLRDRDLRDRDGRYTSRYSPPPSRRNMYAPRRRGPPGRDNYRPRSNSRSRSPIRRGPPRYGGPRRSPSYERGGTRNRRRSRSRSPYSLASSRSRSRSRTRSRSYSYSSRSSRSRTRSPRSSRSRSREDIRDSRSRSRSPL